MGSEEEEECIWAMRGRNYEGSVGAGQFLALFLFPFVVDIFVSLSLFVACFQRMGNLPALSTSLVPGCLGGGPGHDLGKEVSWGKITYTAW